MQILQIDSSANVHRSRSKDVAREFVEAWQADHPDDVVVRRDLGANPVPPASETMIAAAHTPADKRSPELAEAIAVSDTLIAELFAADAYVFSIPMYNFTIPAQFKAYIDQVVISGRTFNFGPNGFEGLVKGKRALIVSGRSGDYGKDSPMAAYDFHEPYLRTVLGFIGISDISFLPLVNSPMDDEAAQARKLEETRSSLREVATRWAHPGQPLW